MVIFRDIPPNQGGKYGGFGFTMDPPPRSTSQEFVDNALSSLASVSNLKIKFLKCSATPVVKIAMFSGVVIVFCVSIEDSQQGHRECYQDWRDCIKQGS